MIKQACNEQMISVPLSLYDSSILQLFASYIICGLPLMPGPREPGLYCIRLGTIEAISDISLLSEVM